MEVLRLTSHNDRKPLLLIAHESREFEDFIEDIFEEDEFDLENDIITDQLRHDLIYKPEYKQKGL